jgi:uncharacterized protein YndB with AHSA1/START domain
VIQGATDLAVRKTITVAAPQQRAFDVFTTGMTDWWLRDSHHIGEQTPEAVVMEPRAGGRWFERAPDGKECDWGRVVEWEPPARVLLAWHLGPEFKYDPDPARSTELEVRLLAEGPATTRVELVHRGFEVHGPAGEELSKAVGGPEGWNGLLQLYVATAEGSWLRLTGRAPDSARPARPLRSANVHKNDEGRRSGPRERREAAPTATSRRHLRSRRHHRSRPRRLGRSGRSRRRRTGAGP